jgi:hypothetical protein
MAAENIKNRTAASDKPGAGAEKLAELNWRLHLLLWVAGVIICASALLESYFQTSSSPLSLLNLAHREGFLAGYGPAKEPNKGIWHMVGIIGGVCFAVMMTYSIRKRFAFMMDVGSLRSWLDVHMFLGIVGAVLTTTHTTYKLGGLVSISFWCMVIVATSGLLGRYLYGWIPHQVSGKELEMEEVRAYLAATEDEIRSAWGKNPRITAYYDRISGPPTSDTDNAVVAIVKMFAYDLANTFLIGKIWVELLTSEELPPAAKKEIFHLIRQKNNMLRSRNFLSTAQRLLHYWHVLHKPLAVMMFIVMFLHIIVWALFRTHTV